MVTLTLPILTNSRSYLRVAVALIYDNGIFADESVFKIVRTDPNQD